MAEASRGEAECSIASPAFLLHLLRGTDGNQQSARCCPHTHRHALADSPSQMRQLLFPRVGLEKQRCMMHATLTILRCCLCLMEAAKRRMRTTIILLTGRLPGSHPGVTAQKDSDPSALPTRFHSPPFVTST